MTARRPPSSPSVVIGVLTFRRPDDLAALVPLLLREAALAEAHGDTDHGQGPGVEILVVDNDPAASARPVVESIGAERVRYVVEPVPGIAAARNRVLTEAQEADFLLFIDDDERPCEGWLRLMLDTRAREKAAGVAGAVVSSFSGELDPWVAAGGFFERRRLRTGTPVAVAATNNLLLDMAVVRSLGLRFDERFGISGGSDTLFTRRLTARGQIVWCDEAVVTDHVPAARMTREWVLRRAFRSGNSACLVDRALAGSPLERLRSRLRFVARGTLRLAGGAARWLVGAVTFSERHRARGMRTSARGGGMLAGAAGIVYREYRRSPRRSRRASAYTP